MALPGESAEHRHARFNATVLIHAGNLLVWLQRTEMLRYYIPQNHHTTIERRNSQLFVDL